IARHEVARLTDRAADRAEMADAATPLADAELTGDPGHRRRLRPAHVGRAGLAEEVVDILAGFVRYPFDDALGANGARAARAETVRRKEGIRAARHGLADVSARLALPGRRIAGGRGVAGRDGQAHHGALRFARAVRAVLDRTLIAVRIARRPIRLPLTAVGTGTLDAHLSSPWAD